MGELVTNIDWAFHKLDYSLKSVGFVGIFCEVIYSKIQRTSLLPRNWLAHLADRLHNNEKFYYSTLRYKIQYGLGTSYFGATESFLFQHLPTDNGATQPYWMGTRFLYLEESAQDVKLTTNLCLTLWLRTTGAIIPLYYTPSWHGQGRPLIHVFPTTYWK